MRIRDLQGEQEEPHNLLSLIDTLFFLVMFFLVATQFKAEEREEGIQLPGLASSQPLSGVPQQLVINVREDGTPIIGGKAYGSEELRQLLAAVATKEPGRQVLIRADERSLHKHFAGVASLCRRAGIPEVKIGYILENE